MAARHLNFAVNRQTTEPNSDSWGGAPLQATYERPVPSTFSCDPLLHLARIYSYGLHSYGLRSHGLHSYGPHFHVTRLRSHGLHSYGPHPHLARIHTYGLYGHGLHISSPP